MSYNSGNFRPEGTEAEIRRSQNGQRSADLRPVAGLIVPGAPTMDSRLRPGPWLDPFLRRQLATTAKWVFVLGIILSLYCIPTALNPRLKAWEKRNPIVEESYKKEHEAPGAKKPAGVDRYWTEKERNENPPNEFKAYWLSRAWLEVLLSTCFAALSLRVLFWLVSRVNPRWRQSYSNVYGAVRGDPVETARDFMVVGIVTGMIYFSAISLFYGANLGPEGVAVVRAAEDWWSWRLPLLFVAGLIGMGIGRTLALRRDEIWLPNQPAWLIVGQVLLHVALLIVFSAPLLSGLDRRTHKTIKPMQVAITGRLGEYTAVPDTLAYVLPAAGSCVFASVFLLIYAGLKDMELIRIQRRNAEVQRQPLNLSALAQAPAPPPMATQPGWGAANGQYGQNGQPAPSGQYRPAGTAAEDEYLRQQGRL